MQNDNVKIKDDRKQEDLGKREEKDAEKEEIVRLKQKVSELENQVKRIFADYQNLEKRAALERREWLIRANKDLILKLLPALDFLLLSSKHIEDEGLKLSVQKFFDILKAEGVKKIEALEKNFDPSLMEGVGTTEGEEGKVINETRSGYLLYDKMLRPALVIVGKKGDSETSSE